MSRDKELPLISHENSSLPPYYLKFYPSMVSNLFFYDIDMPSVKKSAIIIYNPKVSPILDID